MKGANSLWRFEKGHDEWTSASLTLPHWGVWDTNASNSDAMFFLTQSKFEAVTQEANFVMDQHIHQLTWDNLVTFITKYKFTIDKHRRKVEFDMGDFLWTNLTKDNFLTHEYYKLKAQKIGPYYWEDQSKRLLPASFGGCAHFRCFQCQALSSFCGR